MLDLALNADNPKPMPRELAERLSGYADWNHTRAVLQLYRATRNPDEHFVRDVHELTRLTARRASSGARATSIYPSA
jgi:hypothetical protein